MAKKNSKIKTAKPTLTVDEVEDALERICGLIPEEIARCAVYRVAVNKLGRLTNLADEHDYEVDEREYKLIEELEMYVDGTLGMFK